MPVPEAKRRANDKWDAANMKQWNVSVPIAEAEQIDCYCRMKGLKRTTLIRRAVQELMMREPADDLHGETKASR